MTNQTTQNGLTPSLFDVSIPGSPTPKINAAIDNRSLGDFNLTLGDLMTKVIERKESRLHGEYELKFNITHTQNFSDTDLLKRIYDAESYSRYYSIGTPLLVPFQTQTSGYRTYTNSIGEVKIDTSIPFSISQPVAIFNSSINDPAVSFDNHLWTELWNLQLDSYDSSDWNICENFL